MAVAPLFGARIKRREDPRLITGQARYLEDLNLPGMAHAAILRSPHARARIKRIDSKKAARLPGVIAVLTGQDFADINPLPCAWQAHGVKTNASSRASARRCGRARSTMSTVSC
jgi:carbon-monoxide dehydrogenase large subunit